MPCSLPRGNNGVSLYTHPRRWRPASSLRAFRALPPARLRVSAPPHDLRPQLSDNLYPVAPTAHARPWTRWSIIIVNIVACIKETPSTTAEKTFGADMRLERRKEDAIPNPFDEYTIEEGLRQQEKQGGETIVLCMGP